MRIVLLVNNIIKFSSVDGPGNRMVIFLQGCNYNCSYCHNPETIGICSSCKKCVDGCPTEALTKVDKKVLWDEKKCIHCNKCIKICPKNASPMVYKYDTEELMEEIKKVAPFLKGITISGGEATIHYKGVTELFKKVKEETSLDCFVDTNGSLPLWEQRYQEFIEVTDFFMLDVKAWNKKDHKKLTGQGNRNVKQNLEFLLGKKKLYEVRTVIVPGVLDNAETVREVSEIIKNKEVRYKVIKYRQIGVRKNKLEGIESPMKDEMKKIEILALEIGVKDVIVV